MPILPSDIKLLESERMRDTPDGGGRHTGREIPSGVVGNVFPKVSRVDSVYGRVNLRKIYVAVRTATLDMYAGAHAIITKPPSNERISCCLFSTGSSFDTRMAARDRIESYVVAGPISRLRLYGNQIIGQKAILCYQLLSEPLPDVGEVLVLSQENSAGVVSAQQYVRITDMSHELRTFTDMSGEFQRRVITIKIGSSLVQTFVGGEVSRFTADNAPTKVRVTQVADASKYYGLQPLAEAGDLGAMTLRLMSVYAPLVPSTQRETAVSLAQLSGATRGEGSGSQRTQSVQTWNTNSMAPVWLSGNALPGSVSIPLRDGTLIDDRAGAMVWSSAGGPGGAGFRMGTIDYETGVLTPESAWISSQTTVTYTPAAVVSNPAHTRAIPVTLGTRGTVYAETLNPMPAPGTLIVDFRALGRWYRLRDNGAGELVANDPQEGTGSVSYPSGAVIITLGALPDVGSSVILSWGTQAHYTIRAGATADAGTTLDLEYTLQNAPIVPGSVTISYPVGGTNRDVTDPSSNGNLTGTGVSGTINYATGEVSLKFSTPPDRASFIDNAYTWRDGADLISTASAVPVVSGTFTVPGQAPFRNAGSMTFSLAGIAQGATGYITSGGAVRVRAEGRAHLTESRPLRWDDQQIGVFDKDAGVVTITNQIVARAMVWDVESAEWVVQHPSYAVVAAASISVERDTDAFVPSAVTGEQVSPSQIGLTLDLTTTVADPIIAGSVMFRATGKTYIDRNGTLYTDVSSTTGSGLVAGDIDYETGVCTLTFWADNVGVNRAVDACLTTYGEWTAVDAFFRTAGSPVRPASLYIQATTKNGDLITGTADQNGVITGAKMRGTVEQTVGVVSVEFGDYTGPAGAWEPIEVMPNTIRYNSVVLTNLPLEASILGLDPVRLPADGRVPIYRPADVVVIHNTQDTALPDPVTAGQTYSVGRADLATLTLWDATDAAVPTDRYVTDLAAGTVTIAADWTAAGVTQPLTARHRIEHMSLLSDVQINGQIELTDALPRAFPLEGSYVSSALLYGDLAAIVTNVFDQQTWTNVWSDALIGNQANAEYDLINYPIEILNESAVTERWRIQFNSTTTFQVFGENLGQIATGNTSTDLAPINPVTGEPYFVMRAAGWGGGWATGNNVRFNTVGAAGPTWVARTILAGATLEGDQFDLEARGDVDIE